LIPVCYVFVQKIVELSGNKPMPPAPTTAPEEGQAQS
jgi:hypothetical protein